MPQRIIVERFGLDNEHKVVEKFFSIGAPENGAITECCTSDATDWT